MGNKILFLASDLSYGGAEKMLCFVAEGLAARGNTVKIINMMETDTPERELDPSIEVINVDINAAKGVRTAKVLGAALKCIRSFKPDVIISFKYMQNLYAGLIGKMTGVPVIISERADPSTEVRDGLKGGTYWAIINSADGGVFQTKGAMAYYKPSLAKRSIVIPNPVWKPKNEELFKGERTENSILTFGRLDNFQKRYDVMIDAFDKFHEKHPEYVLKIYGYGPDEDQIKAWIEEHGLTESILMCGFSKDPVGDGKDCKFFLITSDFEGISNALLEAMAAGMPVVSTDSPPGGARLLIKDHENGLLVPIRDADAIASAMCEFAENDELRKKCGENSKQIVVKYAPEKILDRWDKYVNAVIKRKKNRGRKRTKM